MVARRNTPAVTLIRTVLRELVRAGAAEQRESASSSPTRSADWSGSGDELKGGRIAFSHLGTMNSRRCARCSRHGLRAR